MHLRNWSTRKLSTPIKAPTNTPIGKQLASLIPSGAVRLEHTERPARPGSALSGASDTFDLDGDGRADVFLESTRTLGPNSVAGPSQLKIVRPGASRVQTYSAERGGQVDSFWDGNGATGTTLRDNDQDGRVDEVKSYGADRGDLSLAGHAGTPLDFDTLAPVVDPRSKVTTRALVDSDGDGTLDQETVGGLWWRTDD